MLARWLVGRDSSLKLLLLDEPTRGVDVGARTELYGLIRRLAERGVAVLLVSSEVPEVLGLADRVLVMRDGRIIHEAAAADLDEDTVLDLVMAGSIPEGGRMTRSRRRRPSPRPAAGRLLAPRRQRTDPSQLGSCRRTVPQPTDCVDSFLLPTKSLPQHALLDRFGHLSPGPTSGEGNALIAKYLATLGCNQEMIEWALTAGPTQRLCLTPELAKKFNIDFWLNSEDGNGQHYPLPGNHGLLPTTSGY